MSNPYSSPATELVDHRGSGIGQFKRFSAWGVLGLTVITFGIYYMYWFFSRSNRLNQFYPHKINPVFIWGSLATYIIYMVFSNLVEQLADRPELLVAGAIASFAYLILYVGWVFAFRNRLIEMAREDGNTEFKIGPVMTFFFQALYLQYKINEYHDKHLAGTSA